MRTSVPALPFDVAAADLDLVLDRGRTLLVRAVARVDDPAHLPALLLALGLVAQVQNRLLHQASGFTAACQIVVPLCSGDAAMAE